jgi:hypothetical protein
MIDVAIIPREKFSKTGKCIRSLCRVKSDIGQLLLFDVGYPEAILHEIKPLLSGFDSRTISYESYRLANACLNDIRTAGSEPWILVIENDCELLGVNLSAAIQYADEMGFDVIQARIMEDDGITVHYDPPHSYIDRSEGRLVHRVVRNPRAGYPVLDGRRRIFHVEKHAFLIRRDVLASLGDFEDFLVTRSHWDLSLRLHDAGHPVLMDSSFSVKFSGGVFQPDDREYFFWRWDLEKARFSNEYVQRKWNIANYRSSLEWLEEMLASVGVAHPDSCRNNGNGKRSKAL